MGGAGVEAAQPRPTPTFPITKALRSPALSLLLPLQLLTKWHQRSKSLLHVQGQKPISKQLEPRQTSLAPFSSRPLGLCSQGSRVELAGWGQSLKEAFSSWRLSSLLCHHLCVGLGLEARSPRGWACDMGLGAVMT